MAVDEVKGQRNEGSAAEHRLMMVFNSKEVRVTNCFGTFVAR